MNPTTKQNKSQSNGECNGKDREQMQADEERTEKEEADEEQQQKVTFQSCAVKVCQFCEYIWR